MNRIAWLTDIHLNFLTSWQLNAFFEDLKRPDIDSIVISGDIGEAHTLIWFLEGLSELGKPIYFVLGNHDYYFGSFDMVKRLVRRLVGELPNLTWLTDNGIIELAPTTGLIGHDSWADGRYGDFMNSPVMLNDYVLIQDFVGLRQYERLQMLNMLGDIAAEYFIQMLPEALERYQHVYVVTHVPPFREATVHEKRSANGEFLPHYSCKAVGDVLMDVMRRYPEREVTVLCGHTHGEGTVQILENLRVLTGGAEYGSPQISRMFEIV